MKPPGAAGSAMLFIEVTHLLGYARSGKTLSGIQRLTFNAAIGLVKLLGEENVELLAYSPWFKTYRTAPASLLKVFAANENPGLLQAAINSVAALARPSVRQLDPNSRAWDLAIVGKFDKVLLTESWWWRDGIIEANEGLSYPGGPTVYRFVHDVIPITAPRFVGRKFSKKFAESFMREASSAHVLIANSNATQSETRLVLDKNGMKQKDIVVIPLAHEFKSQPIVRPSAMRIVAGLPSRMKADQLLMKATGVGSPEPFVLVVGTLERRKNMLRLLKVWRGLAAKHGAALPKLVFVGQWGVTGGQIWRYLRKIKYLGGRIKILHFISDEQLRKLYQASQFTMYLSSYEGWGLPIGESLWLGKPVLASDASSIPEVGGKLVDYVDPDHNANIAKAIEKLVFDRAHHEQRKTKLSSAKLRSWDDFASGLAKVMGLAPNGKTLPHKVPKER